MNRRELIQIFGAATIVALLPAPLREVAAPSYSGMWRMTKFVASRSMDSTDFGAQKSVNVGVSRSRQKILEFHMHPYGSMYWLAPPLGEIYVPAGQPMLDVWTSDSRVSVLGVMQGEHGTLGMLTPEGLQCFEGLPA